jgi:hypothetical protein
LAGGHSSASTAGGVGGSAGSATPHTPMLFMMEKVLSSAMRPPPGAMAFRRHK